jgi:hypothetical protein
MIIIAGASALRELVEKRAGKGQQKSEQVACRYFYYIIYKQSLFPNLRLSRRNYPESI